MFCKFIGRLDSSLIFNHDVLLNFLRHIRLARNTHVDSLGLIACLFVICGSCSRCHVGGVVADTFLDDGRLFHVFGVKRYREDMIEVLVALIVGNVACQVAAVVAEVADRCLELLSFDLVLRQLFEIQCVLKLVQTSPNCILALDKRRLVQYRDRFDLRWVITLSLLFY